MSSFSLSQLARAPLHTIAFQQGTCSADYLSSFMEELMASLAIMRSTTLDVLAKGLSDFFELI
jgi:hypothetical protein